MNVSRASLALRLVVLAGCLVGCGDDTGDATTAASTAAASTSSGGGAGSSSGSGGDGGTSSSSSSSSAGAGGTGGSAPIEQRVFVTSKTYQGDMGGLAGADAECQSLADGASLGGVWLAWLSDGASITPVERLAHSTMPYVLVGGTQIAADWTDLLDGTIAVPIDHDETGTAIPAADTTKVWTGTTSTGMPVGPSCAAWTSVNTGGVYGSITATDGDWSFVSGNGCDSTDRLYCFEQ